MVLITGRIIDDSTNPMGDVIIKLDGKVRGSTDMMGYFEIEIARGIYDLTATSDGFAPYSREINLINGSIELNITLRKMDFAIVRGNVKDRSGMGLAGVKVEIRKQNKVVEENITDADGNYYVEIPAGSYIIVFIKEGYETDTSDSLRVEDGEEKVVPDQILLKKEKTVSRSAASKYWPWAVLIFVIGLVIILVFVVVRRPIGKPEEDEDEEAMGAADAEEAETPGPEVVSVDIGPPGPPGIGQGAVPSPVGETAEAAQLPQMEDRPALTDGATEMLALPAGPEDPVAGEGFAGTETDEASETVEPAGETETEIEEEIADAGEPEAAVPEPDPTGETAETAEAAATEEEPEQEAVTEQPVIPAATPGEPSQPVTPATPEAAPLQPAATVPVPPVVPTQGMQVPAATEKPKRKVVRRRVVKKPVSK